MSSLLGLAEAPEAVARLEAEHTSLLVRQRFDAATLDAMDEPPAWLEPLLMHKHWRRLLISLLEVNPGCLFLRLAVRQVQAGRHAAEVAAHPGLCALLGAGVSLPEFVSTLSAQLQAFCEGAPGALDALRGGGCASEDHMLSAQLLLLAAAHHNSGAPPAEGKKRKAASLVGFEERADKAPRAPDAGSHAGAAIEPQAGAATAPPPATTSAAATAAAAGAEAPTPLAAVDPTMATEASRVRALDALWAASRTCERNEVSALAAEAEVLHSQLHEPVVACAVLCWTRLNLTTPQLSASRFTPVCLPVYLKLVAAIVERHPPLRRQCLRLLCACLHVEPEDASEALGMVQLKQQLLSCVLLLLLRGCALPALEALREYLGGADHALVRHGLLQLLRLVAPPFSDGFGRALLRLLQLPATRDAFRLADAAARQPLLLCVQQLGRQPALARETAKLLKQLEADVGP